jgi:hypothetical protein
MHWYYYLMIGYVLGMLYIAYQVKIAPTIEEEE